MSTAMACWKLLWTGVHILAALERLDLCECNGLPIPTLSESSFLLGDRISFVRLYLTVMLCANFGSFYVTSALCSAKIALNRFAPLLRFDSVSCSEEALFCLIWLIS